MPTVIAVTSEKGGVGKSTLAVHLTAAFAGRGLNAALIDEVYAGSPDRVPLREDG